MKRFLLLSLLCVNFSAQAQNPTVNGGGVERPLGVWKGELKASMIQPLRLAIEIRENLGVGHSATLVSLDQGAEPIDANSIGFIGDSVFLRFLDIGVSYRAKIKEGLLDGKFKQNNRTLPLRMTRGEKSDMTLHRPQTPQPPFPYESTEVSFTNPQQGNTLSGTLTTPQGKKKCPAVVLVSGSGPQNRDEELAGHKPFLVIADYLTREGIAVLRYDDRGVGQSEDVSPEGTTHDLAWDAQGAIDFLRENKRFSSVGVIGHSEGGTIACILAGDPSYRSPDFVVSLAGTAVSGAEILLSQQRKAMELMELSDEYITNIQSVNKAIYPMIVESQVWDEDLEARIRVELNKTPQGRSQADLLVETLSSPWMYNFIKFDPSGVISGVKCPVMALFGTLDFQVLEPLNATAFEKALSKSDTRRFEVHSFVGLNHLFQKATTGAFSEYSRIEQTIAPKVLEIIAQWCNQQ